jgi:hypothetical protein
MRLKNRMKKLKILIGSILICLVSCCGGGGSTATSDTSPPTIQLTDDNPQTINHGVDYTELGATAQDNVDGDISANISIDSSAVDTNTIGSYDVTYDVADSAGNAAATQTRIVSVVDTPPVIALIGANPQEVDLGTAYIELRATAKDNIDGDISANIIIDNSAVDTNIAGNYSVTYDVTDAAGNAAITITRIVNVMDTSAPLVNSGFPT